jgi:ketosteroid isomerase-like protein
MTASRRSMLATAGAGLALMATESANGAPRAEDAGVARLVQQSQVANAALMRGDIDTYRALLQLSSDFVLMSPFGGTPSRGADITSERWDAMRQFFRNGMLRQELVHSWVSADMVTLATIEHAHVEVGGLPAQDWTLRVTLVYCREGETWRLAHRHADPLGISISVEQAAALGRGATRDCK